MRPRYILSALLCVVLAACGPGDAATSTTVATPSTSTTTPPAPTTTVETTTTTTLPEGVLVLPVALDTMPDTWVEAFQIPYGDTPDTLGTYLGGDGEGIQIGPDYGAQGPDGSWWFLDTAKFRLAHFSESGEYLGEVVVPESLLTDGIYFQYQLPRVLSDGTFLASRLAGSRTHFLRLRGNTLDSFSIPYEMTPRTDDGIILYGFSFDEDSTSLAVDPMVGAAGPVDWFLTRAGNRFRVAGGAAGLVVELPDASTPLVIEIQFEAGEIGGSVYTGLEVIGATDGTLHLFLLGFPERDESLQLAGYMTISAEGQVSAVEPIQNPFSTADTGSPSRLGVQPGTNRATYMIVSPDGVRVYVRR